MNDLSLPTSNQGYVNAGFGLAHLTEVVTPASNQDCVNTATLLNEVVTLASNQVYANTDVGLTHLNKPATSETKFDDSIFNANPVNGVAEQVAVSTNPAYGVTEQVAVSTNPAYVFAEQLTVSTNRAYGANNADP